MKANIGISEKNSKEVGSVLNKILADEYLLYTKTRNYHWNIEGSNLVEQEYTSDQKSQLKNLLDDHEAIIRFLRLHIDIFADKYKDAGNADFITGLMQKHEKMAWFLRSHLK